MASDFRSAVSGRYVSPSTAKADPERHVEEKRLERRPIEIEEISGGKRFRFDRIATSERLPRDGEVVLFWPEGGLLAPWAPAGVEALPIAGIYAEKGALFHGPDTAFGVSEVREWIPAFFLLDPEAE